MSVLNSMLGIIFFLFPYLIYVYLLKRLKVGNIPISLFVSFSCLAFCFAFFVVMDREVIHLVQHLLHPTVKFYGKYYVTLGTSFVGFPLLHLAVSKNKKVGVLKIISLVFSLLSLFALTLLFWAEARYPIDQPKIIYFVLSSPVEGGVQDSIIISILVEILLPLFLFCLLFFFVSRFEKIKKFMDLWRWTTTGTVIILFFVMIFFSIKTKIWKYPQIFVDNTKPLVVSQFFDKEFISVDFKNLEFPQEKRNLIVIFLESMESSFASMTEGGLMKDNLIPNLTSMASQSLNFSHKSEGLGGGVDIDGTSWTIAALVSKLGGIPFNPSYMSANPSVKDTFFPKLVTLTDILKNQGYAQRFIFGSAKSFASRGVFFESHGEVEVHDIDWYKNQCMLPENYEVFWGFEDTKLYEYAKMELEELAVAESPFFFGMLTVDTHSPEGYICPDCVSENGESQIQTVIKCADRQIGAFMEWLSVQPFYDNTTVVITGDHLFMETEVSHLFGQQEVFNHNELGGVVPDLDSSRRWLNIFINSVVEPVNSNNRHFSSFDMFPSMLEAMGVKIPEQGLGFGRSLFGTEPTLLEEYGIEQVNKLVMERSKQYLDLLY